MVPQNFNFPWKVDGNDIFWWHNDCYTCIFLLVIWCQLEIWKINRRVTGSHLRCHRNNFIFKFTRSSSCSCFPMRFNLNILKFFVRGSSTIFNKQQIFILTAAWSCSCRVTPKRPATFSEVIPMGRRQSWAFWKLFTWNSKIIKFTVKNMASRSSNKERSLKFELACNSFLYWKRHTLGFMDPSQAIWFTDMVSNPAPMPAKV